MTIPRHSRATLRAIFKAYHNNLLTIEKVAPNLWNLTNGQGHSLAQVGTLHEAQQVLDDAHRVGITR